MNAWECNKGHTDLEERIVRMQNFNVHVYTKVRHTLVHVYVYTLSYSIEVQWHDLHYPRSSDQIVW